MHFSKAEKILHDNNNFNPPPGYYPLSETNAPFTSKINKPANNQSFTRQERFNSDLRNGDQPLPGPGSYFNDRAARIKKRMLDDVKKKQNSLLSNNFQKFQGESEIKISSIPSIPKKSATRVYEELAPGILILHEQENQGSNVGPGSYLIKEKLVQKKSIAYKINPEPKKKNNKNQQQPQAIVPAIPDEIRQQRRQMYKKKLFKSSGINKSMISPSDLCLEVIILREKLLRSDQNPPPGYYYNDKYQSSFKDIDPDMLPEYQLFMGKQQRFKDRSGIDLGPGQYQPEPQFKKNAGGFIPKQERKLHAQKKLIPGPGSYKVQYAKEEPVDAKGSYPPIFGSGCNRFYSVQKKNQTTPGPGSYKIDQPKKKKQKYVKVKRNYYDTQITREQTSKNENDELISMGGDRGRSMENYYSKQSRSQKKSHVFTSKVERFTQKQENSQVGPGMYDVNSSSVAKSTFNKNRNGYVGQKEARFDDSMIRPDIGPGTYFKS